MSVQTFQLLILGSSAATPTVNRNPTSQLLNIAERFFLIDCGESTQIQLRKYKLRFDAIDNNGIVIKNSDLTINPQAPRSYAFCSDTRFFEGLASDIKGVDLLYHESTFLQDKEDRASQTYHSTSKQAAKMAVLSEAKKLVLGHFSARYDDLTIFLNEAKPIFENTELAIEGKLFLI